MSESELEQALEAAEARLDTARQALAPRHRGGEWAALFAAREEVLRLERELAAVRGEAYAVPLDFPVRWDVGAPMPHLLRSEHRTFLIFRVSEPDPNWDGRSVTVRSPADPEPQPWAVVELLGCAAVRFGGPNDEAQPGHPLYGRGLDGYTAQRVENSRWLAELESVNRLHPGYRPGHWEGYVHHVFWFHDSTFECIAREYRVEQFREPLGELLGRVCQRLRT